MKNKKKRKQSHPKKEQPISLKLRQALTLQNEGDLEKAASLYTEILKKEPNNRDALHLSGVIALHAQNFDKAKKMITQAIKVCPNISQFHINLGLAHASLLEYAQAEICYKNSIKIDPKNIEGWFQLGNICRLTGRKEESIPHYQTSLKLNPNHSETLNNIGNSFRETGKHKESIPYLTRGIESDPTIPELHNNLGNTYIDANQIDKALACFTTAIKLRPDFADPHNNIGYILQHQGKLNEALPYLNKALEITPHESAILHNIGNVYKDMGDFEKAIEIYREALALKPDFTNVHTNILFALNYAMKPNPRLMLEEAKKWNAIQAAHLGHKYEYKEQIGTDRPLRVGYISPDFFLHSVSFFFRPLLKGHDKTLFETFCYADVLRPDAMTNELQNYASHWRNTLGWSDEAVAQRINEDRIDILIDLAGHTAGNRLLVFARKPAPIQASWLGYPNTTGLTTIDYRISDNIADPQDTTDKFYTEKIVRLPHSFLCYSPPQEAPPVAPLPAQNNQHITFGSFNNITKITKEVVATWSAILQQVPNAILILKGIIFSEEESKDRFFKLFTDNGIGKERITLKPLTTSIEEHLATYNEIDIALDPFPYNGTTTTCEALWMGVPVITLGGEVHCARVSSSILHNCDLPELVTHSRDEYISKAIGLANDTSTLIRMRETMREKLTTSHLCNAKQFCTDMEDLLQTMRDTYNAQHTSNRENTMPAETKMDGLHLNQKGEHLFTEGRLAEAQAHFEKAIQADPGLSQSHNNLGVLFFHQNALQRSISCFQEALRINPTDESALDNLSTVLQEIKKTETTTLNSASDHCNTAEELQEEIAKFPFWYHKIDLPFGITTPGYAPISRDAYRIPADLSGKRVLDVGAWDGHWTFEALRRGAREVVAIDDFSDYLGSLEQEDRKAWQTFDFCKKQLGYTDEQCKRVDMSVYDLTIDTFGSFDVVFFFGTLYHLRHPLLALDKLAAVCTEEIYVESAILDDFSPYRGGLEHGYANNDMVMEFYPTSEYGDNDSNWFCPTLKCLVNLVAAAGFSNCEGWKLTPSPTEISHCRGFTRGVKQQTE